MLDPEWFAVAADVTANLAAGWLAAGFAVPLFSNSTFPENVILLLLNLFFGIVSSVASFHARTTYNKRKSEHYA